MTKLDVEQGMKVVKRVSYKYKHLKNFIPLEDLQQEGFFGLMKGHDTWVEGKGCSYPTWIIKHIMWAMCAAINEEWQARRVQRDPNFPQKDSTWQAEAETALIVHDVYEELTLEEQELLTMRFWDNKTQEQCAEHYSVVQRTIGKREAFALDKMRSMLLPVGQKRSDLRPDKGGRWPNGYE